MIGIKSLISLTNWRHASDSNRSTGPCWSFVSLTLFDLRTRPDAEPVRDRYRLIIMKNGAVPLGAAALAVLVTACSQPPCAGCSPAPRPATVTGVAAFCTGLPLEILHRSPGPITVYAHKPGLTLASGKIPARGGQYRLLLPPGRYVISAPASRDQPKTINVHNGDRITVNFPNNCR